MKTNLPILLLACLCGCEKPAIKLEQVNTEDFHPQTNFGRIVSNANNGGAYYHMGRRSTNQTQFNHDPQPAPGYTIVCDQNGHFAPARNGYPLLFSDSVKTNYQDAVRETWEFYRIENKIRPRILPDSTWTECK